MRVSIVLDAAASPITTDNLAATCVGAAKHYIAETSAKVISVVLYDQQGTNWGHTQLAMCNYAPDNGGWSGSQGWTWEKIEAADRTTTQQEKEITHLWNGLREKFQSNGSTNEKALSAEIAKRLGISPKDVTLPYLFPVVVEPKRFEAVVASGPIATPLGISVPSTLEPEPTQQAPTLTTKQVHAEVKSLLKELDSFRNTTTFKQCIYGCGSENPGKVWNARRKALQDQMSPQLDMPAMLKAAPANLWSLGMAYGKNNKKDVKWFRDMVEEGLAQ